MHRGQVRLADMWMGTHWKSGGLTVNARRQMQAEGLSRAGC